MPAGYKIMRMIILIVIIMMILIKQLAPAVKFYAI